MYACLPAAVENGSATPGSSSPILTLASWLICPGAVPPSTPAPGAGLTAAHHLFARSSRENECEP